MCDTKCINTYKLKTDAVFFLLDDNFNIWRLINDPKITPEMVKAITFMYSLTDPSNFENDPKNYGQLYIKNKKEDLFVNMIYHSLNGYVKILSKINMLDMQPTQI